MIDFREMPYQRPDMEAAREQEGFQEPISSEQALDIAEKACPLDGASITGRKISKSEIGFLVTLSSDLGDFVYSINKLTGEIFGVHINVPVGIRTGIHREASALIADVDTSLNQAFGVWREKKMAGRTYMGTVRTTFIIDEQGIVKHIIEKVNTKDSVNQILAIE